MLFFERKDRFFENGIRNMRHYPEYKDSGMEWIGKTPSHWQTTVIKHLTKNLDGKRIPLSGEVRAEQKQIYPYYGANGVIDYVEDYIFEGEHILIGEDGAPFFDKTRDVSLLVSGKFWVNNHCHILKNIGTSEARFIVYCLNSVDYFEYITGSTRDKLTQADLNRIKIPIPSHHEQIQIANFLDRKTKQIDELIRIKERQIELLQEQRIALINWAVTKGLDLNVEVKPSGVEWIGEIPAHWTSKRLGHVSTIFKGGTPSRNVDRYFQGDMPWARPVDITALQGAMYIQDTEIHITEEALDNSAAKRLPSGTVLLTSRATIGEIAITTVPMATNQGFANFVCNEQLYNVYLAYYLRGIKDLLISLGSGSTYLEVTKGTLVGVRIPLPPLSEQKLIVNFLNQKTEQIDKLITTENQKIQLLKEYRQSLISEAVTGKIDVQNEA